MSRLFSLISFSLLTLSVISCDNSRETAESELTTQDFLRPGPGIKYNVMYSTDRDEIDRILSTSWVEILKVKGDWIVDTPTVGEVPRFEINSDTLAFEWGDGIINFYTIDSVRKTGAGKEALWKLNVTQFFKGRTTGRDTLTISINLVGISKAYWKVGTQLDGMFLDYNYIDDFARQEIDYDELEKDSI